MRRHYLKLAGLGAVCCAGAFLPLGWWIVLWNPVFGVLFVTQMVYGHRGPPTF